MTWARELTPAAPGRAGSFEPHLGHTEPSRSTPRPVVTADDAMTLDQARALSGRRGARLVLTMGESQTGKTALIAMLWQRFLEADELDGHRLAGSRTTIGLERRAHWARLESGRDRVRFPATTRQDEGLLHLRVRPPRGERVEVLMADLAGDLFERVREGRPLLDELPLARRADRFAIVIDAGALSRPGDSEIAITRATRLLLALRAPGVVRETARVAVVLTKCDELDETGMATLARHEPHLLEIARESDPEAVCVLTAAAPSDGAERRRLGEFVGWLCREDRVLAAAPVAPVAPARSIAAFRA